MASPPISSGSNRITIIEPRRGLADLNIQEIWAYRDLLFTLAQRDVKLRYRQTALGVIWVVFQPLMASLIFTVVFGVVGKGRFGTDGRPPFLFIFAGQMTWAAINNTVSRTSASLIGNANLVSKIYFPRLVLPLSSIGSIFIDFGVSLILLLLFMIVYHMGLTPMFLLMPFFLALIALASVGVGLYAAALIVSYRDISYILPVIMTLLMYISPVNYSSPQNVPHFVKQLYTWNPVTPLVSGMRWTLLGTPPPSLLSVVAVTALTLVFFFGGAFLFRSMEKKFADVI